MSNHLAIAAVTATFQRILQAAIQEDVYGARVTTVRPSALDSGPTETGINIYLYLITPNHSYRAPEPITRRPVNGMVKKQHVSVDLQYILSFYGNEIDFEPQRLYGSTVRLLQDGFAITPAMIRDTLADPTLASLAGADLAEQVEPLRIEPTEISVENLSKVWSVFFQTPYTLSCTYKATVVLIEGDEPGECPLPPRNYRISVAPPFRQLMIERVLAREGALQPILANSTIVVTGQRLANPNTVVRVGHVEVQPEQVTDTRITLSLTSLPAHVLRAGAQSLQVIHPLEQSNPNSPFRTMESNLGAFVLRPTIVQIEVTNLHPSSSSSNTYSAEVTIRFDVLVGTDQLVVLILNEWAISGVANYLFKAARRESDSHEVTITVNNVKAGDYLVRVQIDGAESLLTYDTNPNSPTFNWYNSPRVTIHEHDSSE